MHEAWVRPLTIHKLITNESCFFCEAWKHFNERIEYAIFVGVECSNYEWSREQRYSEEGSMLLMVKVNGRTDSVNWTAKKCYIHLGNDVRVKTLSSYLDKDWLSKFSFVTRMVYEWCEQVDIGYRIDNIFMRCLLIICNILCVKLRQQKRQQRLWISIYFVNIYSYRLFLRFLCLNILFYFSWGRGQSYAFSILHI